VFRRPFLPSRLRGVRLLLHVKIRRGRDARIIFLYFFGADPRQISAPASPLVIPAAAIVVFCVSELFHEFPVRFLSSRCSSCDARTPAVCLLDWAYELSGGDGDRGPALAPVHCGGRGEVLEELGNGISFINFFSFVTLI